MENSFTKLSETKNSVVKSLALSNFTPEQIESILNGSYTPDDLTQSQIDKLKEYRDALYENGNDIQTFYNDMGKRLSDAIGGANNELQK
jgi:hypothetical protein